MSAFATGGGSDIGSGQADIEIDGGRDYSAGKAMQIAETMKSTREIKAVVASIGASRKLKCSLATVTATYNFDKSDESGEEIMLFRGNVACSANKITIFITVEGSVNENYKTGLMTLIPSSYTINNQSM